MSICSFNALSYTLKVFDFHNDDSVKQEQSKEQLLSLEDLAIKAISDGIEPKQKIQSLIQSRYEVNNKLARILPQFDLIDPFATSLPFVGFLFPNRWYDLFSSKYLKHAEEESLKTFFANTINMVQHLYYDIQMQVWSLKILYFYIDELSNIIEFLKTQNKDGVPRANKEDIGLLNSMLARIKHDRAFMDSLASALPRAATAIGLDPDFDWAKLLKIDLHKIDFGQKPKIEYADVWPLAEERSTEISNINYLIKAAKKNMLSIYFDVLDPEVGKIIDFGYPLRIKIEKSKIKILTLELDRTRMEISNAIQDSLNYYAESTYSLPVLEKALFFDLEQVRIEVEKHINDIDSKFEVQRVIRYLQDIEFQSLRYVHAYFVYLTAKANFDRYKWEGPLYDMAKNYIENYILYKKDNNKSTCKICENCISSC